MNLKQSHIISWKITSEARAVTFYLHILIQADHFACCVYDKSVLEYSQNSTYFCVKDSRLSTNRSIWRISQHVWESSRDSCAEWKLDSRIGTHFWDRWCNPAKIPDGYNLFKNSLFSILANAKIPKIVPSCSLCKGTTNDFFIIDKLAQNSMASGLICDLKTKFLY